MNKMNKKGFTLIEMLVVIAIIAVLVAIIVPTVSKSTTKAKAATDAANLRSLAAQVTTEYLAGNSGTTLDGKVAIPESKSFEGAKIYVIENATEIEAYFVKGTTEYYGVDALSKMAEGDTPTADEIKKPTGSDIKEIYSKVGTTEAGGGKSEGTK